MTQELSFEAFVIELQAAVEHRQKWSANIQAVLDKVVALVERAVSDVLELPQVAIAGWHFSRWHYLDGTPTNGVFTLLLHSEDRYVSAETTGCGTVAKVPGAWGMEWQGPRKASRSERLEAAKALPELLPKLIEALKAQGNEEKAAAEELAVKFNLTSEEAK